MFRPNRPSHPTPHPVPSHSAPEKLFRSPARLRGPMLALLLAGTLLPLGCSGPGPEPPEEQTPDVGAAAPLAASSAAAATVPTDETPAPVETPPSELSAGELAERERVLAEREARVAERESTLEERVARLERQVAAPPARAPEPSPSAAPPPPAPDTDQTAETPVPPTEPGARAAVEPAAPGAPQDESWRFSHHRTDRAAREGYDPETGGASSGSGELPATRVDPGAAPEAPPPERTVEWETRLLPSGTPFAVELGEPLASDSARVGDTFRARIAEDVTRAGEVVIAAGTEVIGRVLEARALDRKIGGRARLDLAFDRLVIPGAPPDGEVPIQADFAAEGRSETARDAAAIGGAAAGGAVLGRVIDRDDKDKASVLGAILGAAAGTVIAARTEGDEVVLPEGARIELVLTRPAEVPVPR